MPLLLKRLWLLLFLLLIPLLTALAAPQPSEPEERAPPAHAPAVTRPATALQGHYVLDRTASDDIRKAVDNTVSRMSFITRGIARKRLEKNNPAFQRIDISRSGDNVTIASDGVPVQIPLGGNYISWTRSDGATFQVSARETGTRLIQTFLAKDGQRMNAYSLSPDGRELTMAVTITSPRLPAPLTYRLVFQRAS